MRVTDDAAAAAERHDRRVDHLCKREDFLARVNCAAADKNHRRLAVRDQRSRGLDAIAIGPWRRQEIERFHGADLGALREHIPGHFQGHRSAPARQHFLEGAAHQRRRHVRIFDALGPFHKCSQRCELVRHLVQMAAAFAQKWCRHLSGQAQHRLVRAEGGE